MTPAALLSSVFTEGGSPASPVSPAIASTSPDLPLNSMFFAQMPQLPVPSAAGDADVIAGRKSDAPGQLPEKEGDLQMLLDLLLPGVATVPLSVDAVLKMQSGETSAPSTNTQFGATPVPLANAQLAAVVTMDNAVADSLPALPFVAVKPGHSVSTGLSPPTQALLGKAPTEALPGVKAKVMSPSASLPTSASPLVMTLLNREEGTSSASPKITLPAAPAQQAEALQKALGERLEMQIAQRTQQATIRLDPPHLGKLDISIHYEAGKLQVQIQAAQPEICRVLQQLSNELRTSLSEQNNVQVNVQVSGQNGDSRQQRQQRHQAQPTAAIAHNNDEVALHGRRSDGTILTMV